MSVAAAKPMHTPGPWELAQGRQPFVTAASPSGSGHRITIADCAHPADAFHAHQRAANARLIASAPDLLEACRMALELLDDRGMGQYGTAPRLRAAIRKATQAD